MAGSQQNGPGNNQHNSNQNGQGPGYHYEYNYNYNFNGGPSRPPRKDNGWGDWIGIIILFVLPFGITQVIASIWAIRKVLGMSRQQRNHYYNQFRQTAERIKRDVEDVFRDNHNSGFSGQSYDPNAQNTNYHYTAGGQQSWAQPGPTAGPWENPGPTREPWEQTAQKADASKKGASAKKAASSKTYKAKVKRNARKVAQVDEKAGNGLIIGGAIMSGIFGLGTATMLIEFLDSLFRGYFFSADLIGVLACGVFFAGGLAMLLAGIGGKNRRERILNYLGYIGTNEEIGLAHMAATFGVSVRKLCKDLRYMLSKNILPYGYLDLAEGKLYLTDEGYQAREPESSPQDDAGSGGESAGRQKAQSKEDAILREIRQINEAIPDESMSAKISRIEEITAKILAYQKSHPNRESQLRPFLNYYLPTTLKILRAYAQLEAQGVEGENITAATERIEGMMDQVVAGFEKQLDRLFQDDAMDITSDVQVLENMLKKDGLSGDNMTMTM